MSDARRLAEATIDLCRHVLGPGEEAPLTDLLEHDHRDDPVVRVGHSLVVGEPDGRPVVALVGHLDVVPPTAADAEPRVGSLGGEEVIVGRGTSDMKSGVAVARALYRDPAAPTWPVQPVLVLYAGEEGSADSNELTRVLAEVPWLGEVALAIVLEPTDLDVHVGCLGALHAVLTVRGRQAHSARPWEGDNAVTKAVPLLAEAGARAAVPVEVGGVTYRDTLVVTQVWTDNARNVVPGAVHLNVNFRFAPTRGADEAERELRDWVADRADVAVVDRAPPAPPRTDHPAVAAFVTAVGAPVRAKQAWTDVARFAERGVPAVNYGPGLTSQAHQAGEHVPVRNLVVAYERVRAFLAGRHDAAPNGAPLPA